MPAPITGLNHTNPCLNYWLVLWTLNNGDSWHNMSQVRSVSQGSAPLAGGTLLVHRLTSSDSDTEQLSLNLIALYLCCFDNWSSVFTGKGWFRFVSVVNTKLVSYLWKSFELKRNQSILAKLLKAWYKTKALRDGQSTVGQKTSTQNN